MEEFKAKRHAVKRMTRKGLVETDSREGRVKETAEAKSDGGASMRLTLCAPSFDTARST